MATNERFENFIEDDDDRFSEIELRVLDLEKDISEWREARTRELTRPARRQREPEIGLTWEAGEPEPEWENDEEESGWDPGEPEAADAVTFRGAGAPRQREFLRAAGQPPPGLDQGRTQALIEHGRQTARPRTVRRQPARRDTPRQKATGRKATGQQPGRPDTGRQKTSRQDTA